MENYVVLRLDDYTWNVYHWAWVYGTSMVRPEFSNTILVLERLGIVILVPDEETLYANMGFCQTQLTVFGKQCTSQSSCGGGILRVPIE